MQLARQHEQAPYLHAVRDVDLLKAARTSVRGVVRDPERPVGGTCSPLQYMLSPMCHALLAFHHVRREKRSQPAAL
jgi:hypothetical protein